MRTSLQAHPGRLNLSFRLRQGQNVKRNTARMAVYAGDVWTWVAIDVRYQLVPCWMSAIATRTPRVTSWIPSGRLAIACSSLRRPQGVSDARSMLRSEMRSTTACGLRCTVNASEGKALQPWSVCLGCERKAVTGNPDPDHVQPARRRHKLICGRGMLRFISLDEWLQQRLKNLACTGRSVLTPITIWPVHRP